MDFIAAPILVFLQGRFEDPRYYDGDLGPVFLLLPFFMTGKKQEPWMKWMLGFCGLFFFYWIFSTKQIRFLLPIIPVLCFFLSWCAASCRHPRAMTAVILIGVAYGFFAGGRMLAAKQPLDYWLGRETREDYLTRNLENYAIYQKANQLLPRGARLYLINMKNYGYYLNTAWESDFVFERYVLDQQMKTVTRPSEILTFFQTRRISHLMIDERFIAAPEWGVEPHALELFKRFLAEHAESLHTDRGMTLYALKN